MGLPLPPNTTFDLYRPPNLPPSAPDSAGNPCVFQPDYGDGLSHGERDPASFRYEAVLLCDLGVDVRDTYDAGTQNVSGGSADYLFLPDQNGAKWQVIFVERVGWGTATDHKRVYLQRAAVPPWPTTGGI
jgi:hypothetical protein